MTEERKNEIIKTVADMSADKLVDILELYYMMNMNGTNTSEEASFMHSAVRTEILSRMSK